MIKLHETAFSVGMMCRLLSVARSLYYAWRAHKPTLTAQANGRLRSAIKAIFDDEKGRVGSPRITARLWAEGTPVARKRVARIMRDNGWRAKAAKKYKTTTQPESVTYSPDLNASALTEPETRKKKKDKYDEAATFHT